MRKLISSAAAMLLASACGGGAGTVSGTVAGNKLAVRDAVIIKQVLQGSTSYALLLSDGVDSCTQVKANTLVKNETLLFGAFLDLDVDGQNKVTIEKGTYAVASPLVLATSPKNQKLAITVFEKYDATCQQTINTSTGDSSSAGVGSSGTIVLDSFSTKEGDSVKGSLDITFGSGDRLKGSFNATFCDASNADTSTDATCK